jgi:hypothetical protein
MMKALFAFLLLLASCASIRVISATKQGGEVVLEGPRESAMSKARDEMTRVCGSPKGYEIVEEGEIGFNAEAGPKQDPKEWHVHYECTSRNRP